MKIIHTGDIHIGSALKNLPADKARLRKAELLGGFLKLCAYAKESGVSAVLIAGDLFDENAIAIHIKREVLGAIERAKPVAFYYVSGNHDDEFDVGENLPENLYVFSKNHAFESYALGEGVTVTGMDTKNFSQNAFSSLFLLPENFNILLLHGDIYGSQTRENIPLALLANKNIDYLALGHIHQPTLEALRLDGRGKYRYCGCLEGRGFDELGERGFFLIEIQNKKIVAEKFLSFATRKLLEVRVDVSSCKSYFEVENAALSALGGVSEKDIVKLILCGRCEPSLKKDVRLLSSRLCESFFFVKAEDESRVWIDAKTFEHDLTERGEFVREVGRYAMNEKQREEILEVGLKALAGEEIDL